MLKQKGKIIKVNTSKHVFNGSKCMCTPSVNKLTMTKYLQINSVSGFE